MNDPLWGLTLAAIALLPLWLARHEPRWHATPLLRAALALALAFGSLGSGGDWRLLGPGWGVVGLTSLAPAWLLALAARGRRRQNWSRAATLTRVAGWLVGGKPGRLLRGRATALRWQARGDPDRAGATLAALASQPLPPTPRAAARYWELQLLVAQGRWEAARELHARTTDWGCRWLAAEAQLLAARAAVELGDPATALAILRDTVRSPWMLTGDREYLQLRLRLAALTGLPALAELRAAEAQWRPWRGLALPGRPRPATTTLTLALALVFVVERRLPAADRARWDAWLANDALAVRAGEWWRMLSGSLLHVDLAHLLGNLAGLLYFGTVTERSVGRARWGACLVVANVTGSLASMAARPGGISVGASAGVFGLLGLWLATALRLPPPPWRPLKWWALLVGLGIVVCDPVAGVFEPAVNNAAHFGGFLGGLAVGWLTGRPRGALEPAAAAPL